MSGRDHDADLLDSLGELIGLHSAVVVQVEVLERLHEHGLFVGGTASLLGQLCLERFLETRQVVQRELLQAGEWRLILETPWRGWSRLGK